MKDERGDKALSQSESLHIHVRRATQLQCFSLLSSITMTQLVTHTHTRTHSGALTGRMKDEKANCKNDTLSSPPLFSHIYLETDHTHFTAADTTYPVMTT